MSDQAWLDSLRPGDKVIYEAGSACRTATVERRTKTLIITSEGKFKNNGVAPGEWATGILRRPTEELLDQIRQRNLAGQLEGAKWKELSLGKLRLVMDIVRGTSKCSSFTPEQKKIVDEWVESRVCALIQEIDRSEKGLLEIDKRPRDMYTPEKPGVYFRYARQAMLEDLVSALEERI